MHWRRERRALLGISGRCCRWLGTPSLDLTPKPPQSASNPVQFLLPSLATEPPPTGVSEVGELITRELATACFLDGGTTRTPFKHNPKVITGPQILSPTVDKDSNLDAQLFDIDIDVRVWIPSLAVASTLSSRHGGKGAETVATVAATADAFSRPPTYQPRKWYGTFCLSHQS